MNQDPINSEVAKLNTLLLVDDDDAVREAITDILELEGIRVIGAADGASGIATYEENMDEIGLILLDMSMPGMSGTETFAKLCEVDHRAKIILSSGFGEQQIVSQLKSENLVGFLPKPYDSVRLISMIRQHI